MFVGYIYVIRNKLNQKLYVGQTAKDLSTRFKGHCKESKRTDKPQRFICKALQKYGFESFEIRPIDIVKCETPEQLRQELDIKEIHFIKIYDTMNRKVGYNLTSGGGGSLGHVVSEDVRKRTSNTMKGVKKSEETKKRMSKAQQGRTLTEEAKEKIRASRLKGKDNPRSKMVAQYSIDDELIAIYESMSDAARAVGSFHSIISNCCRGVKISAAGFKWKYYSE
jgi:group I intron endonuclease